jgi:hypothetical protein
MKSMATDAKAKIAYEIILAALPRWLINPAMLAKLQKVMKGIITEARK